MSSGVTKLRTTGCRRDADSEECCGNCHNLRVAPVAKQPFCDLLLQYTNKGFYCNHYEHSNMFKMMMHRDIEKHDKEMEALHEANNEV